MVLHFSIKPDTLSVGTVATFYSDFVNSFENDVTFGVLLVELEKNQKGSRDVNISKDQFFPPYFLF